MPTLEEELKHEQRDLRFLCAQLTGENLELEREIAQLKSLYPQLTELNHGAGEFKPGVLQLVERKASTSQVRCGSPNVAEVANELKTSLHKVQERNTLLVRRLATLKEKISSENMQPASPIEGRKAVTSYSGSPVLGTKPGAYIPPHRRGTNSIGLTPKR